MTVGGGSYLEDEDGEQPHFGRRVPLRWVPGSGFPQAGAEWVAPFRGDSVFPTRPPTPTPLNATAELIICVGVGSYVED